MKRISNYLLVLFVSMAILAGGISNVKAGEFSAGATVMYGWWKPFLANYLQQLDRKMPIKTSFKMNMDSVLYAPMLGYKISDTWNISFILLMALHNQFSASSSNATLDLTGLNLARSTTSHINKYDADLRANHAINKYASIFIAVNAETDTYFGGYNAIVTFAPIIPITLPTKGSLRSFQYDCGPGAGVDLKFELVKNFYAQIKLSLYVMAGKLTRNIQYSTRKETINMAFKSIDEVIFSYYIESARATVSIGGRYHAMTFALMKATPTEHFKNYTTLFDQMGGITASVAFVF